MQRSYIPTTVEELRLGLSYARERFAVPLCGDLLEDLFNKAIERYTVRKHTSRKEGFISSAYNTLKESRKVPQTLFKAYLGALGAMAAHRRNHPFPQEPIIISDEGPLRPDEVIASRELYGLGDRFNPMNWGQRWP